MKMEFNSLTRKMSEIDTRAPFRSVKEAVSLFGDKVLAGELYHLKQMNMKETKTDNVKPTTTELEDTKHSLEKAKEESIVMANNLSSLQEELERTKLELDQLKKKDAESEKHVVVEKSIEYIEIKAQRAMAVSETEFEKKRYVAQQFMGEECDGVRLKKHQSLKKKVKKRLISLNVGALFSKKKGTQNQYQHVSA